MSYGSWKNGADSAGKGKKAGAQEPGESDQDYRDRVAGSDWARKNTGK